MDGVQRITAGEQVAARILFEFTLLEAAIVVTGGWSVIGQLISSGQGIGILLRYSASTRRNSTRQRADGAINFFPC